MKPKADSMNVIILHYHLNPGGVTTIIEAQVRGLQALSPFPEVMILCGNSNDLKVPDIKLISNRLLDYQDQPVSPDEFSKGVSDLIHLIRSYLKDHHSILHCHNINLGKNPALSMAVFILASEGIPVINHLHDFAEDRPANMALMEKMIPPYAEVSLQEVLYPGFPQYHFIVLNSCDYSRLLNQGVKSSQVHLVPNPVSAISNAIEETRDMKINIFGKLGFDISKMLCVYPVRAIERKNPGEFILLAALFGSMSHFAVTQAPRNPLEIPKYNRWKSFCKAAEIPVQFEAGDRVDYGQLIKIADFCITTSIREGFGMAYLEPWLAGTPVIGRELSCITDDLKKQGIQFPRLYNSITVTRLNEQMDFKDLQQDEQENLIREVIRSHKSRSELFRNNPFLSSWLDRIPSGIITANQQIIRKRFSIEAYGKELSGIYKKVSG